MTSAFDGSQLMLLCASVIIPCYRTNVDAAISACWSLLLGYRHWRRQLWGTGARAPLNLQQFNFFSVL